MQNVLKYVEIDEIGLSAKGEVLINKDFIKIIKSAKDEFKIPYIYISSNGALMDKKSAIEIIDAGMDSIKFSINAVDAKSYEMVHQVDDFQIVIENFKTLLKLKKERYPHLKVALSSVVDLTLEELTFEFKKLFGEDFNLIDAISLYPITYTPKFNNLDNRVITRKCSIPFRELYINSNGTLGLCCKDYFDEINFGSLLDNDFLDIYNSKEFLEIREMHKKSMFPDGHLCKNCLLYGED
jgi:wyosine [tRNA(Phe)-imidazoG37] synthetase (radical SAM superfamily)